MKTYDVIVVGSGGGTKLVRPVADQGKKVAIIEKEMLGGTCLNRGCIPSKMLIHAADVATMMREAGKYHLTPFNPSVDFEKLVSEVNATTDRESFDIAPLYDEHPNIDYIRGEASFTAPKILKIGEEEISAEKIFLAVGCHPRIPKIEGLEGTPYMTYREALRNRTLPKRMAVIGGGYIAVELGYFYGSLGVETHFLVREVMLRGEDDEVRAEFEKTFSKRFPVHFGFHPKKVVFNGEFNVICENKIGEILELKCDALLVATGVEPTTAPLNLKAGGIEVDRRGFIQVDDHLMTSQNGVYAFGDCIGRYLFRHSANFEGEYLFRQHFGSEEKTSIQYVPVPHAVFSHPQIGAVGKTEQQLKEEGIPYLKGVNAYKNSGMGMALKSEDGFVKLLFHAGTKKLLGAHVIGDEASNMVHMLIAYMVMGADLNDLLRTIYIHPALPEVVRNAARKAKLS